MDVDQRRARREARQHEVARRRKRGLAAVAVLAVAVVLAALLLGSSGSSKSGADNASSGGAAASEHARRSGTHGQSNGSSGSGAAGSSTGGSGTVSSTLKGTALPGHGPKGTESVPILMYHVINPPPAGAKFPGLYVDPEEFEAQMQALKRAGFHAVTMDQMLANWTRGAPMPEGKPIHIGTPSMEGQSTSSGGLDMAHPNDGTAERAAAAQGNQPSQLSQSMGPQTNLVGNQPGAGAKPVTGGVG